jgi:hypothetical protein
MHPMVSRRRPRSKAPLIAALSILVALAAAVAALLWAGRQPPGGQAAGERALQAALAAGDLELALQRSGEVLQASSPPEPARRLAQELSGAEQDLREVRRLWQSDGRHATALGLLAQVAERRPSLAAYARAEQEAARAEQETARRHLLGSAAERLAAGDLSAALQELRQAGGFELGGLSAAERQRMRELLEPVVASLRLEGIEAAEDGDLATAQTQLARAAELSASARPLLGEGSLPEAVVPVLEQIRREQALLERAAEALAAADRELAAELLAPEVEVHYARPRWQAVTAKLRSLAEAPAPEPGQEVLADARLEPPPLRELDIERLVRSAFAIEGAAAPTDEPPAIADEPPAIADGPPVIADGPPAIADEPPAIADGPPADPATAVLDPVGAELQALALPEPPAPGPPLPAPRQGGSPAAPRRPDPDTVPTRPAALPAAADERTRAEREAAGQARAEHESEAAGRAEAEREAEREVAAQGRSLFARGRELEAQADERRDEQYYRYAVEAYDRVPTAAERLLYVRAQTRAGRLLAYRLGDYAGAVERYERALRKDRRHPILHYELGYASLHLGRLQEAIDALSRVGLYAGVNPGEIQDYPQLELQTFYLRAIAAEARAGRGDEDLLLLRDAVSAWQSYLDACAVQAQRCDAGHRERAVQHEARLRQWLQHSLAARMGTGAG